MFYNSSFFAKPSMDFIQLWRDDRALSKILCSTIPIPVHDLKIKVTDFEFFCVKSLQCQLLQSLWLIWIVFGMNGYKILKCFRKEKRVSGELPCLATGLITVQFTMSLFWSPFILTIFQCWTEVAFWTADANCVIFISGFTKTNFDGCSVSPKLLELTDILIKEMNDNQKRGIIFVKTRQLAGRMIRYMRSSQDLNFLCPTEFLGQNVTEGGKYNISYTSSIFPAPRYVKNYGKPFGFLLI